MKIKLPFFKRIMLLMLTIICLGCISGCNSESKEIYVPEVKADTYVYDKGEIISNEIKKKTNDLLDELESKTSAEVVVITVPDLNGYDIESYANKLFNKLGIGKNTDDNGVLLLISRDDKRVRLEIGRGFESLLTDSVSGRILDNYFVPYREKGDYDKAVGHTTQAVCKYIADESEVFLSGISDSVSNSIVESKEEESSINLFLIIMLIIIIIFVVLVISGDDSNGSGGYFGGGSFGGGFSGGSSFGGGFSGGGGASR